VRATWTPKGQTPVLRHRFSWTRLSMSGALGYRPDGSETALLVGRHGIPWLGVVVCHVIPYRLSRNSLVAVGCVA
jgi:hypothetical protein